MFRWLNLTDIHVGMADQDWLWPGLGHELRDDLSRLIAKIGPVEAILFSGDLVQRGSKAEFGRFTDIISGIVDHLGGLGQRPKLVTVPGNHDLVRPEAGGLLEASLRQIPDDHNILRKALDSNGEYLSKITELFEPFLEWRKTMIRDGIHAEPAEDGLLPGDASYVFGDCNREVGIAVLNSAWLQLGEGNYQGRLHVDLRQLLAITGEDAVGWCRSKWARLLVTHHPSHWLASASQKYWASEIFPPDRFDVHLFGHMHESDAAATTRGGAGTRRALQGASIFGLERTKDGVERAHGYSICEISEPGDNRVLRVWPRKGHDWAGDGIRLYPDQSLGLNEDNYFEWPLVANRTQSDEPYLQGESWVARGSSPAADIDVVALISAEQTSKLRFYPPSARAHLAIRNMERKNAVEALDAGRATWIACDWGAGEDGFLWSILSELGRLENPIFRLDLENYAERMAYLSAFEFENGFTFQQLCEHLSGLPNCVLLLDGIRAPISAAAGQKPFERDVEEVCGIIREFAPAVKLILRGRFRLDAVSFPAVELRPLDEADVADYVRAHEQGGPENVSSEDIALIWRHTGGSPARLDALLRDLEITSLSDLVSNDIEYRTGICQVDIPPALAATVEELRNSEIDLLSRAYQMLEALSSLPRGEQFQRMRRFLGPHGFWTKHVHELSERGLVNSVFLAGMAPQGDGNGHRALLVPRIVRDFIRDHMTVEHRREIDTRAVELYFGEDWRSGEITASPAGKRCREPLCEPYEVANATILIQRLMMTAYDERDSAALESGIRLASAFVEVLRKGYHYGSAAALCALVQPMIEGDTFARQADVLRYAHARTLRMLGQLDEARDIFEAINLTHLNKEQKRRVSLNKALIHERLGNEEEARRFAEEVLEGGRKDGHGIQARSVIAQFGTDVSVVVSELKALEEEARQNESIVIANNIAMALAGLEKGQASADHVDRVIGRTSTKADFLNGSRAIVKAMKSRIGANIPTTDLQLRKLREAYQHLHNERAGNLFDQCHEALWSVFEKNRDVAKLFRLFRHSSLIWRLRGQAEREKRYLGDLAHLDIQANVAALVGLDRELRYFRARTAAALDGSMLSLSPVY